MYVVVHVCMHTAYSQTYTHTNTRTIHTPALRLKFEAYVPCIFLNAGLPCKYSTRPLSMLGCTTSTWVVCLTPGCPTTSQNSLTMELFSMNGELKLISTYPLHKWFIHTTLTCTFHAHMHVYIYLMHMLINTYIMSHTHKYWFDIHSLTHTHVPHAYKKLTVHVRVSGSLISLYALSFTYVAVKVTIAWPLCWLAVHSALMLFVPFIS